MYKFISEGTDSYDDIWRTINYSKDNPFLQGDIEKLNVSF